MGCLDDGNFGVELDNGVKLSCIELGLEGEPETVAIEEAVKVLLQGLGEDINREGLLKTPLRVAKALRQGTTGYKQKVKDIVQGALFPEPGLDNAVGYAGGVGGLVVVRDLDLFSYCETCLIPFQIKCHVGYVPCGQRVIGLSKLSRVADTFAKRLQDPWRLVDEICSALDQGIKPAGVAVLLQCSHLRFPNVQSFFLDSNHQGSVKVLVSSGSGVFENDKADAWSDFFSLMRFRGISVDKIHMRDCTEQCWCPFRSSSSEIFSSNVGPANPGMIAAATSILRSLGEDPSRKELIGTPSHFVNWLMNFQNTNFEMKLNDPVYGKNDNNIRSNGEIIHDEGEIIQNEEQLRSELNLPFWSQCEHHLLPFHGVVHIGYFSAGRINPNGRSLLQSVVHFYGFKLQAQERLSRQIAQTVSSLLGDVMVLVEANHTCMISRGIEKVGSNTATVGVVGRFSTDPSARCMFLKSIPNFATSAGSDFSSTA